MAIKTVSNLDTFDNGDDNLGSTYAGGNLNYFQQSYPKNKDGGTRSSTVDDTICPQSRESGATQPINIDGTKYYDVLFEISLPELPGSYDSSSKTYFSKNITYRSLLKNICFDVKQYLNATNGLYDTNIELIAYEPITLYGKKTILASQDSSSSSGLDVYGQISASSSLKIGSFLTALSAGVNVNTHLTAHDLYLGCSQYKSEETSDISSFRSMISGEMANNDWWAIGLGYKEYPNTRVTGSSYGYFVIATGDDKCEPIYVRLYWLRPEHAGSSYRQLELLNEYGNTNIPGDLCCVGNFYSGHLTSNSGGTTINGTLNTENIVATGYISALGNLHGYNVYCKNALEVKNGITVKAGGINITGNSTFNGSITVKGINGTGYGSIIAGDCTLTASAAKWSDLAEYYFGDEDYDPGTLVKFGGKEELTLASDKIANAVVTSKPAYVMNADLRDHHNGCAIALAGRVPVKVVGKILKFDKIVLSLQDGIARARKWYDLNRRTLGISLESSDDPGLKMIECVVKFLL